MKCVFYYPYLLDEKAEASHSVLQGHSASSK